jgi:DNA-binding NarL/FixJ family response regulator
MQDSVLKILFLGENPTWFQLSQTLGETPAALLDVHRLDSLADLFQSLAAGCWDAVAIDVHAWNFQGLHYVEKVRSEYPAFPILAVYSPSVQELRAKAHTCGASRCLPLDDFTVAGLHNAVTACLAKNKAQSHLRKAAPMQLTFNIRDASTFPSSKNRVITHALNNLLCVISANADLLADHLTATGSDAHPLQEIKKAAQSAAALMRQLK